MPGTGYACGKCWYPSCDYLHPLHTWPWLVLGYLTHPLGLCSEMALLSTCFPGPAVAVLCPFFPVTCLPPFWPGWASWDQHSWVSLSTVFSESPTVTLKSSMSASWGNFPSPATQRPSLLLPLPHRGCTGLFYNITTNLATENPWTHSSAGLKSGWVWRSSLVRVSHSQLEVRVLCQVRMVVAEFALSQLKDSSPQVPIPYWLSSQLLEAVSVPCHVAPPSSKPAAQPFSLWIPLTL